MSKTAMKVLILPHSSIVPILAAEPGLTRYLEQIRRFPMLEPHEEYMLAKSWREHGDRDSAHRLVTSHLRFVAKIAIGYRGFPQSPVQGCYLVKERVATRRGHPVYHTRQVCG
jgi:DNA-directed RNA polymerase sigma subunit (sigma70/sigma32)